jgi:hypothetical protein
MVDPFPENSRSREKDGGSFPRELEVARERPGIGPKKFERACERPRVCPGRFRGNASRMAYPSGARPKKRERDAASVGEELPSAREGPGSVCRSSGSARGGCRVCPARTHSRARGMRHPPCEAPEIAHRVSRSSVEWLAVARGESRVRGRSPPKGARRTASRGQPARQAARSPGVLECQ